MTFAEFYIADAEHPIVSVPNVGALPDAGHWINIEGKTYLVERVTWTVDHSGTRHAQVRACIELKR